MRYDFSEIDDADTFTSVPEGLYACRVEEVREGRTRDGSPRWSFRLAVVDGEHAGRTAAWDNLVWSDRGIHRVKSVLTALGLDTSGVLEVAPHDLLGREAEVQVVFEEWEDPLSGRRQIQPRVPYRGIAARGTLEARATVRSAIDGGACEDV